ncbi:MAG: hypothetical protein QG553_857 [Patescibacteria group bacterium]|nr:hypothetical protein [Patescibacteria group bacterium]
MVRDTGVEPVSKVWKTFILTAIRIPPNQGYYTRDGLTSLVKRG